MRVIYVAIIVCLSVAGSRVAGLLCDDISTQACQLLAVSKPDLCNDTSISQTTCPRYCNKCALECYHCNQALVNYTDCNTTKACNAGEVCMLKELKSSADSHHEYIMTCEDKATCDGEGLTFPFGKRSIQTRDLSVTCCDSDLCNYPSTQMTSTPSPFQKNCQKDIIIVIDESSSMKPHQDDLLNFLASLVADLSVSPQGTHVSVVTYNNRVLQHFTLTAHYNVQDLQNAIKQISFRGGNDDISVGLSYVLQLISTSSQLLTTDRPTVPDVVIFITDHSDQNYLSKLYEQQLHARVSDVIAVGIGHHNNEQELVQIATDAKHVLRVPDASSLSQFQPELVKTICS